MGTAKGHGGAGSLANQILRACEALGLSADRDYIVVLSDGTSVRAEVRVRSLGAGGGMLVFNSYATIEERVSELLLLGYGYSVMDHPSPDEPLDLEAWKEVFADWGWAGPPSDTPPWMRAR